jgi:hypothetical protein
LPLPVVGRSDPFQRTTAPLTKFEPLTARVKAGLPAIAEVGLMLASTGAGLLIVKAASLEAPPAGPGLKTVTLAEPAAATSPAAMDAVNRVLLPKFVPRLLPFHRTTELEVKPVPVTVRVKAPLPAMTELGSRPPMDGTGFGAATVNATEFDPPPPGPGLKTVTAASPALAISLAGIAAERLVPLLNIVVRFEPFHRTVEFDTKPVPLTDSVNAGPPAMAEVGLIAEISGSGLLIVKFMALEVPPPGVGVKTVTAAVPAAAMSLAGMAAVNCEALPKVVGRFAPFQRTTEPFTKFEPLTASVKPDPPAVAEDGAMPVSMGARLLMVNIAAFDVPPPGPGLKTVTLTVPPVAISAGSIVAVR